MNGSGMVAIWSDRSLLRTYLRSRSSACALALVPASHQLLMPAVKVNGISLAGGNVLSGVARDGIAVWVAVAAAVADMKTFLRIIVGRIMVGRGDRMRKRGVGLRGTSDESTARDL